MTACMHFLFHALLSTLFAVTSVTPCLVKNGEYYYDAEIIISSDVALSCSLTEKIEIGTFLDKTFDSIVTEGAFVGPVIELEASVCPEPVPYVKKCCSWNNKYCGSDLWCDAAESNCEGGCGGSYINPLERTQCLSLWSTCTIGGSECCGNAECFLHENGWLGCERIGHGLTQGVKEEGCCSRDNSTCIVGSYNWYCNFNTRNCNSCYGKFGTFTNNVSSPQLAEGNLVPTPPPFDDTIIERASVLTRPSTHLPTQLRTSAPTITPTMALTLTPTRSPTGLPTQVPTRIPTLKPTSEPTQVPTPTPTLVPTSRPVCKAVYSSCSYNSECCTGSCTYRSMFSNMKQCLVYDSSSSDSSSDDRRALKTKFDLDDVERLQSTEHMSEAKFIAEFRRARVDNNDNIDVHNNYRRRDAILVKPLVFKVSGLCRLCPKDNTDRKLGEAPDERNLFALAAVTPFTAIENRLKRSMDSFLEDALNSTFVIDPNSCMFGKIVSVLVQFTQVDTAPNATTLIC